MSTENDASTVQVGITDTWPATTCGGGGTGQIGHLVNVCDQQNDNSGNVRVYYPGKQEREQHDYH